MAPKQQGFLPNLCKSFVRSVASKSSMTRSAWKSNSQPTVTEVMIEDVCDVRHCRWTRRVLLHTQCDSFLSFWTLCCVLCVCRHVGAVRCHCQTVPTKMGEWNCPKCLGMLAPQRCPSPTLAFRQPLSWQLANPNSSTGVTRKRGNTDYSRELVSTGLGSSGSGLSSTADDALHGTWWRKTWKQLLGNGNRSMEYSMNFSWVNLKSTKC